MSSAYTPINFGILKNLPTILDICISRIVFREGYRLAKWGEGDQDVGVYNGQYSDDQLWKFQQEGDYYRICSKPYPSAKITKFGKDDGDWGTFVGGDYDDQLWKLVPRFTAEANKEILWSMDNR